MSTLLLFLAIFQDTPSDVLARVTETTVVVLCGEGAGRLISISTGVVVRQNGVILTAYHSIKDAKEVQVRLRGGDVFDRVTLIGVDERRDVAALKIAASRLPALAIGSAQEVKVGDPAYAVTNSNGLAWTASQGMFSASRMADEVPGAGQGYRVLQFSGDVAPGASGGPLTDAKGQLVGIITKGIGTGARFAVPIESVIGLADGGMQVALGAGAALQMPAEGRSPTASAVVAANPGDAARNAKTVHVASRSTFFTTDTLERELQKHPGFPALGLALVKDMRVADLLITVDRPLFTYDFTYVLTDVKTSRVLDTGKVVAFDGVIAAPKIAKDLVAKLTKLRVPPAAPKEDKRK
jgi:hypothetical protein